MYQNPPISNHLEAISMNDNRAFFIDADPDQRRMRCNHGVEVGFAMANNYMLVDR